MRFQFIAVCVALSLWSTLLRADAFARSDPADAAASAPAARYESAFDGYVAHREPAVESWRAHNDAVATSGGHAHDDVRKE